VRDLAKCRRFLKVCRRTPNAAPLLTQWRRGRERHPPEGLEEYVNDCKIHVFEISWLTDEQVAMFQSDFKIVANFFVNKRKNKNYIPDDKTTIKHVDEVLKLLAVMSGDRRYEEIFAESRKGKVKNMCDVAERLVNQGRTEGRAEGRAEERAEVIGQMLRNGKTPQEIADFCGYDVRMVKEVEAQIKIKV
jgi:hypothetical protein